MRNTRRVLVFLIVLASVLALSLSSVALADKPDEVGSKAYSYIEALTFAPRVAGTQEEFAAAKMIEGYFSAAGYDTPQVIRESGFVGMGGK